MTGTGFDWSVMPGRRVMIGSLAGAVVSGSLLGLVIGIIGPGTPAPGRVATVAAATAQSAAPTQGTPTTVSPSPSPTPSKSRTLKTVTLTTAPAPDGFVAHPENDRTLLLGVVRSIDAGNPDHAVIWLQPADLVTGKQAKRWYQSQGLRAKDVAVIPRDNAGVQGLTLRPDGAYWGQFLLGDQQNRTVQRLPFDQFLGITGAVLATDQHPAVWVRHSQDAQDDVIYLAEQYVPPQGN